MVESQLLTLVYVYTEPRADHVSNMDLLILFQSEEFSPEFPHPLYHKQINTEAPLPVQFHIHNQNKPRRENRMAGRHWGLSPGDVCVYKVVTFRA